MATSFTKEIKPGLSGDATLTWNDLTETWNEIVGTWDEPRGSDATSYTKETKPFTQYWPRELTTKQKQGLVKLALFLFHGLFFVTKIPQMSKHFQSSFEIEFNVGNGAEISRNGKNGRISSIPGNGSELNTASGE